MLRTEDWEAILVESILSRRVRMLRSASMRCTLLSRRIWEDLTAHFVTQGCQLIRQLIWLRVSRHLWSGVWKAVS